VGGLQKCEAYRSVKPKGEREKKKSRRQEGGGRERAHKAKGDRAERSWKAKGESTQGASGKPDWWGREGQKLKKENLMGEMEAESEGWG